MSEIIDKRYRELEIFIEEIKADVGQLNRVKFVVCKPADENVFTLNTEDPDAWGNIIDPFHYAGSVIKQGYYLRVEGFHEVEQDTVYFTIWEYGDADPAPVQSKGQLLFAKRWSGFST